MDNPRTLPPLVRGKVTGLLDFFIDEIVMCKNVIHLTENLNITAQVRWWGEILPAYIRPKILRIQGKISRTCQSVEAYSHFVQYEIKTSVDLFKSYLKACEVIEISVYDGVENYVIGSAFLKNLSNFLNRSNDFASMPLIDYLGEEIGWIKIHSNFFEYPEVNIKNICKDKISGINIGNAGKEVAQILKSNCVNDAEKTMFYDGCSKITNLEMESDQSSELDRNSVKDSASKLVLLNYESEIPSKNHFTIPAKDSSKYITFPEACELRDSSKILNYDLGLKIKKPEKNSKSKLLNKLALNSVQSKSKSKAIKLTNKEKFPKKTAIRNLSLRKPSVTISNQEDLKLPSRKQSSESICNKNAELESLPETCANEMVFDYLLGAAMSKENEKNAMKSFKKMSPSHDIVSSINELCLSSDESKICVNKNVKQNLHFDLTNPVERNYYEKFFVKNNLVDFEIAELLNEPKSKCALQEPQLNDKNNLNANSTVENSPVDEFLVRKCDNFALDNQSKANKISSNCARCKYYKKLEELDTIIESLKHFEKNMIKQEKRLQLDFESNLSKQGCKMSDR